MPSLRLNFKLAFWFTVLICLTIALVGCGSNEANEPKPSPTVKPSPTATAEPVSSSADLSNAPVIVAFGDSLTAGYGLSESTSYPSLLQRRLLDRGYRYRVVNAGVSGDTTAGGVRRVDWALKGEVRVLILELGANDALRGQPIPAMKKNLADIIEKAQQKNVRVILAGMEALPNFGPEYTEEFRQAFRDLAKQYSIAFIPFFLDRVGGIADLNQNDGIHPNIKGTEIVVENVWKALEPILKDINQ